MAQRSATLADEFEKVMGELADAVESCPDATWQKVSAPEGWTVAAMAAHVVGQFPLEFEYLTPSADGKPLPSYTWDDINAKNDKRAAAESANSKNDVLAKLGSEMQRISGWLRGLSDQQLDHTAPLALADGAEVSTQQLIEGGVLIDHVRGHTKNIQAAIS